MSGFEVAGVILGLYPLVITALDVYRATKGGKGAVSLARNLNTEKIIFGEFVHQLVAPNVSEADLVRLKASASPDFALWNDKTLQANMRARLGTEKADNVIGILEEIQELLIILQRELASSDYGVELLQRFRATIRRVRYNLPRSSLKERLDILTSSNIRLQRLLADRSLPRNTVNQKSSRPLRKYLRRDPSHVVDVYNAIYDSYRCKCDVPHLANLSLPRISDDTRTDSGLLRNWQSELLFAIEESAVDEIAPASPKDFGRLMTTWSQISISGETMSVSRKFSISECDSNDNPEEQRPIPDLCIFTKELPSGKRTSNPQVGFLRLKEKQYQLQTPTTLPEVSSQNVKHLDHLLADQRFLLSRKQRICLALSLSHAILSLYSTPWIEDCWTWKDFCIDGGNEGQLFATRKFYSSLNCDSVQERCKRPTSDVWAIHGEPTLTRLGFALIELALGKRLIELRANHQYQSSDPDMLDLLTAKNLVDSGYVMQAESRAYEDVVRVCLRHQFIRSSELIGLDSSRPGFRENAEESILAPLHMIVTASWGTL